jgi:predicted nuclease of predicted toxin-antitoxin system
MIAAQYFLHSLNSAMQGHGQSLAQSHHHDSRPLWRPADDSWLADSRDRYSGPSGIRGGQSGNSGGLSLSRGRGHNSGSGIQLGPDVSPGTRSGVTAFSFIVDENLPPHLAYWLRDKAQTATHVDYEALGNGPDSNIWKWAAERDAIIISKDEDFHNRVVVGRPPRLIWVRWGNVRKKPLIEKLELLWPEILAAFKEGEWELELTNS